MTPITPDEAKRSVPDEVIRIFNQLINENWTGSRAIFRYTEVLDRVQRSLGVPRQKATMYVNVEQIYADNGWQVSLKRLNGYVVYEFTSRRE